MLPCPPASFLALCTVVAFGVIPSSRAQRIAVEAPHGMVVAVHALAAQAGVDMLRRGGNAVDAAVATGFALAVVYPSAGNLGGGGFMVIHLASDRPGAAPATRDHAIDFREAAPAAATRDMYLEPNGAVRTGPGSSILGWRASGVPGTVAGFALAFEKYGSGKLSWTDVIEPARRLAGEGHVLTAYNAARFRLREDTLGGFPESKRVFLKDGAFFETGELWRQPELAALGHNSSASCHLLVEAMRRAYADRSEYFGDPDFVSVPIEGLLDRAYLARRMGDFDPARATPSDRVAPGRPRGWEAIAALSRPAAKESPETTHYSVIDAAGNAVSTTYTLNTSFGSGVTIPGAGFLMNNEMDDRDRPRVRPAPGRRRSPQARRPRRGSLSRSTGTPQHPGIDAPQVRHEARVHFRRLLREFTGGLDGHTHRRTAFGSAVGSDVHRSNDALRMNRRGSMMRQA